jgi:hypothetical protein
MSKPAPITSLCRKGLHHDCGGVIFDWSGDPTGPCNCPCHAELAEQLRKKAA